MVDASQHEDGNDNDGRLVRLVVAAMEEPLVKDDERRKCRHGDAKLFVFHYYTAWLNISNSTYLVPSSNLVEQIRVNCILLLKVVSTKVSLMFPFGGLEVGHEVSNFHLLFGRCVMSVDGKRNNPLHLRFGRFVHTALGGGIR